jgi:hypothetical protein
LTAVVVILALTLALAATAFAAKKPRKPTRRAHPAPASAPAARPAPPSLAGPAPPTWSPEEYERRKETRELIVVSVYRPVEMEGRTVTVPREVYLQATGDQGARLKEFVGKSLEVYRKVPVPTVVPPGATPAAAPTPVRASVTPTGPVAVPAPASAAAAPSAPVSAATPASAAPSAPAPPSTALSAVARLRALKKAQEQAKANAAAAPSALATAAVAPASAAPASSPPGGAAPPEAPASASPVGAGPADEIVRPRLQPVPSISMEVVVGRLQVVDIRGQVVVARVADDGVGKPTLQAPSVVPAELPAIMAGDVARFVLEPPPPPIPPPPVPPPALSKEEQARLDAERAKAEAENQRRKHKRGKYERKVMKWKL